MKVLAVCGLSLVVAGILAMGPVAVESNATPEPVVQKLGGYELPYSGPGSVIYDLEESTWTIAFKAPTGWACTEVGYSFETEQRDIPVNHEIKGELDIRDLLNGGVLDVHGMLEVEQEDDTLFATVETEEATYSFEFKIHGKLPVESLEEVATEGDASGPAVAGENCPGGSCECFNKCKACCSTGYHPYCNCTGQGLCRCKKNVPKKIAMVESAWADVVLSP